MQPKKFFITGIGTDVGKTITAAILTEALEADYWKPVQSGELFHTDAQKVKALISNRKTVFHPETFLLSQPMSPHAAARFDHTEIQLEDIHLPETANHLIVEGAGGLMVPLNDNDLVIDLIHHLQLPVVLVSRNYLGSINHTLLSIEALRSRHIPIAGIIFNDAGNDETERIILRRSGLPLLGNIRHEREWNKAVVKQYAEVFRHPLKNAIA